MQAMNTKFANAALRLRLAQRDYSDRPADVQSTRNGSNSTRNIEETQSAVAALSDNRRLIERIGSPLQSLQIVHREEEEASDSMQLLLRYHKIIPQQSLERTAELDRIAESVEQISAIYRHLGVLVAEQGALVDRIDYNLERANRQIQQGNLQLHRTLDRQMEVSDWRRRALAILLIVAGLMLTGLMIL